MQLCETNVNLYDYLNICVFLSIKLLVNICRDSTFTAEAQLCMEINRKSNVVTASHFFSLTRQLVIRFFCLNPKRRSDKKREAEDWRTSDTLAARLSV